MQLRELVLHEPTGTKFRRACWKEDRYIEFDPILNIWIDKDKDQFSLFTLHLDADDWEVFDDNPTKLISKFATREIFTIDTFPGCLYKWMSTDKGRSLWIKTSPDEDWYQCKFNTYFNEAQGKLVKK